MNDMESPTIFLLVAEYMSYPTLFTSAQETLAFRRLEHANAAAIQLWEAWNDAQDANQAHAEHLTNGSTVDDLTPEHELSSRHDLPSGHIRLTTWQHDKNGQLQIVIQSHNIEPGGQLSDHQIGLLVAGLL